MADTDDKKKLTMKEIITYIVLGVGALLVIGGVAWLIYSNMNTPKTVSFKTPQVITLTAKKTS